MTPQEFQAVYPQIINWIRLTLENSAAHALTVASKGFPRLKQYFTDELLASTKVVIVDQVPVPPLAALGLNQFAEFASGSYAGITYLDTFFVKRDHAADERLHFHELIHVVQWRLLGPERFLAVYAAGLETHGYRESPLEAMAYNADALFSRNTGVFDAEKWVAGQLSPMHAA
jgi:hypothetical protein